MAQSMTLPFAQSIGGCLEAKIGASGLSQASLDANLAKLEPRLASLREAHQSGALPLLRVPASRDDIAPARDAIGRLSEGATTLVFFGTGGSSLGGQTLAQLGGWCIPGDNGNGGGRPRMRFYDNLDPRTLGTRACRSRSRNHAFHSHLEIRQHAGDFGASHRGNRSLSRCRTQRPDCPELPRSDRARRARRIERLARAVRVSFHPDAAARSRYWWPLFGPHQCRAAARAGARSRRRCLARGCRERRAVSAQRETGRRFRCLPSARALPSALPRRRASRPMS